ncbi:MAG: PIN domain-containing protein [Bacteroidetes bacterium]|nr:MAG: PIN domain-containing protein [Bacteroidota bacterium]TAE72109.1 MAG: PIN domain-containing protein [Bacteroidota bacterium]TAF93196.1 MAG: PIN domain-containing protein [Bacteroidota bacterium]
MVKIFIDSDVLLDFFFDREPFADDAEQILTLCEKNIISGTVTAVILSNMYYVLRKTASHQQVIDSLQWLLQIVDVAAIDKLIVLQALQSSFTDFEDALQNFSAKTIPSLTTIVTRNITDYKESEISVLTPKAFLATLH